MLAKQRTFASRCPSAPMTIGHAGTSAFSLQGVPWVTGVVHCGSKGCTRDTSFTICRSIGGATTADSCRENTGATFVLVTMQVRTSQTKSQAERLTDIMSMSNYASTSTIYLTKLNTDAITVYTCI